MINLEKTAPHNAYRNFILKKWLALLVLLAVLLVSVLVSISAGSSGLTVSEVMTALLGRGTKQTNAIIWNIRMPRICTGIAVGAALALTGCIMQNVLRNPLASASTLGVSQGASFGAAFAIVCLDAGAQLNAGATSAAVSISNPYLVTLCAFVGGFATTVVILALSRGGRISPATMVLAGVALSSLFSGGTTIVQYFADDVKVASVVYWTFGDLGRANWREIGLIFAITLLSFLYFIGNRWNFNAMESGANTAKSLGVPVDRLILISMVLCSLMAAVSTAFVGCISFVGLIAPHMVRRFVGNDYRFLIPASALMGAVVLVLAELVSRSVVAPSILPIGALTSFLGAPLFLYMIFRKGGAAQ
ncbi:MAG: iron ABC transporter permease [Ruminococcaceae bacterium]|nr:iron ABC transporter permease [Oscillospiraceae bacterium]